VDAGGTITTVAGNASLGGGWSGDGGPATNARLSISCGITFDDAGNLYIADSNNHVVRKVDTGGTITTVAGNHRLGGGYSGDGGPATNAALNFPDGVALDRAGNLFISEYYNHVVRKVDAGGIITTVAGNRRLGGSYSGDGGPATEAGLNGPTGLAVDGSGNLYFSEGGNHVIRKVDAGGTITTVAGNRRLGGGYSGDGGPATNAALSHPNYIAVDGAGNLYFPEYYNNVVRMVNAAGTISTLAGSRGWGGRYPGSGGAVAPVTLNNPTGVALDGRGSLYIGDAHNNVVRKIGVAVPAGKITPVAAVLPVKTAVTVSPTPTLQMVKQNGSFLLSWPIGARGYQLLTAYSLTGPWEPLEAEFTTNGNEVNVSILATNQEQYFRFQ
jgi:sugar lactone lactonase YvrE